MASASSSAASGSAKPDRLYIGNLSPTIDEYTLIQVLQKYGSITHLDYMFHKSGALKGKPRGYAFVQYSSKDDALKAMVKLHDRLLRGRKLVVTYASSAPSTDIPLHTKGRRSEPAKTTTLSLLKSQKRPQSAAAQIAAMEAKLAVMNSRKPADEDYVPGQSFRLASAEGSPAPAASSGAEDGEMDLEEELGLVAGKLAADDLEQEMVAELARAGPMRLKAGESTPRSRSASPERHSRRTSSPANSHSLSRPDTPASIQIDPALPPRPASAVIPPATTTSITAIRRGLASLPKKPGFL